MSAYYWSKFCTRNHWAPENTYRLFHLMLDQESKTGPEGAVGFTKFYVLRINHTQLIGGGCVPLELTITDNNRFLGQEGMDVSLGN